MQAWGKILKGLCELSKEKGVNLYILEGDKDLNYYGAQLKEFCKEELYNEEDFKVFKKVKENLNTQLEGKGYVILVSPLNLWADVYEYNKRKFVNPVNKDRPFDVSLDRFRIGFFEEKKEAVEFALSLADKLRKEFNLHLHVFYA
ncbi:hypothetical protein [Aquifex sp.]